MPVGAVTLSHRQRSPPHIHLRPQPYPHPPHPPQGRLTIRFARRTQARHVRSDHPCHARSRSAEKRLEIQTNVGLRYPDVVHDAGRARTWWGGRDVGPGEVKTWKTEGDSDGGGGDEAEFRDQRSG